MTKRRWIRGAVWAAIAATTLFIWSRSLQPAAVSSQESAWVNELLTALFGAGYADSLMHEYIRHVAHFAEFAVLGVEWGVQRRWIGARARWVALAAGPLTAACDEILQLFSEGRAAQVSDFLLDCAGYACGFLFLWMTCQLVRRAKKKSNLD